MSESEQKTAELEKKLKSPQELADAVSKGKLTLLTPIMDGEKEYTELLYDFNKLTGWDIATALDDGAGKMNTPGQATDKQCLVLFAAAAAKCTEGLDMTDIKERIGAQDAIAAISIAGVFFRGSSLAASLRISSVS